MKNVQDILPEIIAFRHKMHQIPELAGEEVKTCALIRSELAKLPLQVLPPFLKTDTVALLQGGKGPGKNVTLRADIDALAIEEQTGVSYSSTHPGRMHACGHDAHTAILLGAAKLLCEHKDEFSGSIRFVFQPGEECKAMARDLIAAGALKDPAPDFVTALHVMPKLPVGMLATKPGSIMASANHFQVKVKGRGGHGSRPDLSLNPVVAAAAMITELQSVTATRISPLQSAVLSITVFHGGSQENIIPDEAEFAGTMRALDNDTAKALDDALHEVCQSIARVYRVECVVNSDQRYNASVNTPEAAALAFQVMKEQNLPYRELTEPSMGAEDFSFFLDGKTPGVYVKIGAGENMCPVHNCKYNTPDEALENGIRYFAGIALAALK